MDFSPLVTFQLELPGQFHPPGDGGGAFSLASVGQITVFDRRDFNVDVDTIQQGAGDTGAVAVDGKRRAAAGMGRVR